MPPDLDVVFHGQDGYLELWRYWLEAFDDIRWDPEEALDLGEEVLVTAHQTGHGSGSGVSVSEPVFQLFTFRRCLVVRQEDFLDRSKAIDAAGLRPVYLATPATGLESKNSQTFDGTSGPA